MHPIVSLDSIIIQNVCSLQNFKAVYNNNYYQECNNAISDYDPQMMAEKEPELPKDDVKKLKDMISHKTPKESSIESMENELSNGTSQ